MDANAPGNYKTLGKKTPTFTDFFSQMVLQNNTNYFIFRVYLYISTHVFVVYSTSGI